MPFNPTRFQNPFSGTLKGGIATVGNTLGLWGKYDPPDGTMRLTGAANGIGCFTSTNTSLQYHSSYPMGTTKEWVQNSSSSTLRFSDSGTNTIVGAYLFYSGTAQTHDNDVRNILPYTAVRLTTPNRTYSILPDDVSFSTSTQTGNVNYSAFKDITKDAALWANFKNETSGTYTLASVPAALGVMLSATRDWEASYAGWTLVVVYHNPNAPTRNINVWDIFMLVDFFDDSGEFEISGFCTPPVGKPIAGKLFVSVGNGKSFDDGDQLLFGANSSSMSNLYGPRNPAKNFYQDQICDDLTGALDTSGTFGTSNQVLNTISDVIPSARFGWDKTMIKIDDFLTNNQQTANIKMLCETITVGRHDVHNIVTLGLQIDLMSAALTATKTITPTVASVGDYLNYTVTITSVGDEPAINLLIQDLLNNATNLSYVNGSLRVNGSPYSGNPIIGFTLAGPYYKGDVITITFQVHVDDIPVPNPFTSATDITYSYVPGCNMSEIAEPFATNEVTVTIQQSIRGVEFI